MVKRNTDFKQVFLVDEFYMKNFNFQNQNLNNAISNNPKISLTTPHSSQYFNNNYNIPSPILKEYNPSNLQKNITPTFDNQKYYNPSKFQSENLIVNRRSETIPSLDNERGYNNSNFNQNNASKFHTNNPNVNKQIGQKTDFKNNTRNDIPEENEVINPPDPFPYYDNYQQDQENDEFNTNKVKTVPKVKDFLNKTQKQHYMCYICKQAFSSILLLEKHFMIKHSIYPNPNQNISDRNDDRLNEIDQNQEPIENANRTLHVDEIVDKDDDLIDIPDPQSTPTDLNNTNNHLSIRNDIQSNFPNARNIVRKKKESRGIEKLYTYKCGKCSSEFRNYDSLKEHQLQSHGDVGSVKRSITSKMQGIIKENQNIEDINSYWCSACGKFFQNFASLNAHLQKDHQNTPMRAKRSKMNDKVKRKKVLYYSRY